MSSECKFCHQDITWTKQKDEKGETKNIPLNPNGSVHSCGKGKKPSGGGEYDRRRGTFVSHMEPNIILSVDGGDRTYYVGKEKWPYVLHFRKGDTVEFTEKKGSIGWVSVITGEDKKPPVNTAAEIKKEEEEIKKQVQDSPPPLPPVTPSSGEKNQKKEEARVNPPIAAPPEAVTVKGQVSGGSSGTTEPSGKEVAGKQDSARPIPSSPPGTSPPSEPHGTVPGDDHPVDGGRSATPGGSSPDVQEQGRTLMIGGTVNLENFEYLKLEVSGPAGTEKEREGLIQFWKESLLLMGKKDEFTRSKIEGYVRRVFS